MISLVFFFFLKSKFTLHFFPLKFIAQIRINNHRINCFFLLPFIQTFHYSSFSTFFFFRSRFLDTNKNSHAHAFFDIFLAQSIRVAQRRARARIKQMIQNYDTLIFGNRKCLTSTSMSGARVFWLVCRCGIKFLFLANPVWKSETEKKQKQKQISILVEPKKCLYVIAETRAN